MGDSMSHEKNNQSKDEVIPLVQPPGFSFNYEREASNFLREKKCCICFFPYDDDTVLHMLPCNHILHRPCLIEWYQKSATCPLCRQD